MSKLKSSPKPFESLHKLPYRYVAPVLPRRIAVDSGRIIPPEEIESYLNYPSYK